MKHITKLFRELTWKSSWAYKGGFKKEDMADWYWRGEKKADPKAYKEASKIITSLAFENKADKKKTAKKLTVIDKLIESLNKGEKK